MAKKSFTGVVNPAEQFLTKEPEQPQEITGSIPKAPQGYRINPIYVEFKTRRVQIVLRPSVYEAAKAEADKQGISFNEMINNVLADYVAQKNGG